MQSKYGYYDFKGSFRDDETIYEFDYQDKFYSTFDELKDKFK